MRNKEEQHEQQGFGETVRAEIEKKKGCAPQKGQENEETKAPYVRMCVCMLLLSLVGATEAVNRSLMNQ